MAVLMSVAFALPVYYLCQMGGSFFVFWLAWLISLADGIGEATLFPRLAVSPTLHHAACCGSSATACTGVHMSTVNSTVQDGA